MDIIIVGHGPSMLNKKWGRFIDEHDVVIRQKRCADTLKLPEHFGTKTHIVCGSFTIATQLPKNMPGCAYWVFMDSRHEDQPSGVVEYLEETLPCYINRELCDYWNEKYRERRTPYEMPEGMQEFTPIGHNHLSAGFHTILYACEVYRPERLDLAGFDNVKSGEFTWSVTRGPEWDKYPDHRWDIEHEMIKDVEEAYGTRCNFL